MPVVKYVRPHVLKRLEELKRQGGKVIDSVPVSAAALQSASIMPIVSNASCSLRWKTRQLDDGMMFFLSNFQKTGTFEATLRVTDKAPELFNPVTGTITRLARYKSEKNGTRISIDVKDRSDSCFIVFRNKSSQPSVVEVTNAEGPVSPADLSLFYDQRNKLIAETDKAGSYTLSMSDGSKRKLIFEQASESFTIESHWQTTPMDEKGYSVLLETTFDLPPAFGKGQRVALDLGDVSIIARVTLNDKAFDTLWMPPFTLDVSNALKPGNNRLEVLVTSTTEGTPTLGTPVQLETSSQKIARNGFAVGETGAALSRYRDGRPEATRRTDANDRGIVLRNSDGPGL
ncbi:MAG: hypothetical protein GY903_14915 [Fuerstiella sp.]|nr:hypothetical protein [Fuerstiella sp.]MCP4855774.1 hypothetical protein [Fuerstiella sp.]